MLPKVPFFPPSEVQIFVYSTQFHYAPSQSPEKPTILRSALFWDSTQRTVVIHDRRFGKPSVPFSELLTLNTGQIGCSETSVRNSTVRCIISKKAQISSYSRRKHQITLITLVTSIRPFVLPPVPPPFRLHVSALLSPDEFS